MRKSIKRRISVLVGAVTLCVLTGFALVAVPASAHNVTEIDGSCPSVNVRFDSFPDEDTPVTIVVRVHYWPDITRVVNVSGSSTEATVDISEYTSRLYGRIVGVTVEVTWTLHGDENFVQKKFLVQCGEATTTSPSTSPSTSSSTSTTTTTTSTTKPPGPPGPGDIFQVELRRCTQVHEGYQKFPAGTVIKWKVKQGGVTRATGNFTTVGGSGYHFITQNLGARLRATQFGEIYYSWTINGVADHHFVRRAPGCSGTTATGESGPGNFFVVELRKCKLLHVGFQYFPGTIPVNWVVKQDTVRKAGSFVTTSGNTYHFLSQSLGATLKATPKASVTFSWKIKGTGYRYAISRATGC